MYGAGNIGRGFIGQLFSDNGYKVGFIDINEEVIERLNKDGQYPIEVVSSEETQYYAVKNVYGINGKNIDSVAQEIASADMMATAIGVNVLKFIAKPIAEGLKRRFCRNAKPFNIIICENLIGADAYLKGLIKEQIPEYSAQIDEQIGFVEASIGRMVPVMTEDKKQGNPLRVCVEPYNVLPVDKDAFKGEIPDFKNLYPYSPFNLFIERKLFMHNMSHATCAYLGYLKNYEYIYQAINDYDVKYVVYKALIQSALAVATENDVGVKDLLLHADNLLYRFTNTALMDTVERVGKDTIRKLSENDRLVGAINLAEKHGLNCSFLCLAVAAAMLFKAKLDEKSVEIYNYTKENGARKTLAKYCNYTGRYVELIESLYGLLQLGELDKAIVFCEEYTAKEIRV